MLKEAEWEPSLYWLTMPFEFQEDSPYYPVGPDDKTTTNVSRIVSSWQVEWMDEEEKLNTDLIITRPCES